MPKSVRPSGYEIEPFDNSLHSEGRGPDEVVLVLRIEHRHEYFAPVDNCEERYLKEMEARLRELGVAGRRRR